jgi:hypothetical protein
MLRSVDNPGEVFTRLEFDSSPCLGGNDLEQPAEPWFNCPECAEREFSPLRLGLERGQRMEQLAVRTGRVASRTPSRCNATRPEFTLRPAPVAG